MDLAPAWRHFDAEAKSIRRGILAVEDEKKRRDLPEKGLAWLQWIQRMFWRRERRGIVFFLVDAESFCVLGAGNDCVLRRRVIIN